MKSIPVIALPVALAMTIHAHAQSAPPTGAAASAPDATVRQQKLYLGSKIIGATVRDARNRKVGQIKDLILDSGRGEVAYVVVSFGGVMGVGRKLHAIPWQALQPGDNGYVLHADRETISQAPAFDKARWPDMADRKWNDEIDRYWSRMVGRANPGGAGISSGSPVANPSGAAGSGTR
ncbi:PRC-barrel domain-containing protein [Noviherbaspirillum denitrificans]|uniref:PRC-barrel domain-containing protein n=1 Tax=Noviherbaspirillum denitrificans TaxID=1968433 RepID=A0A254TLQ1_9BURK|nr:PRC-barrel domain-containing protein [Noviherbaspirillum denitrificans]OWW22262.1 hypothetical protein AYR66_24935 [Noviherbaspirillum denitrificans]